MIYGSKYIYIYIKKNTFHQCMDLGYMPRLKGASSIRLMVIISLILFL